MRPRPARICAQPAVSIDGVNRPALSRTAACLATGLVTSLVLAVGGLSPATTPAAAAVGDEPLEVSIESLSPSSIPDSGTVTVTGHVTNRSDSTWTDLNVYLLTSAEPFTTEAELEEAALSDPASEVGERLVRPGLYDEVGDLAPGASTSYTLSVSRRDLQVSGRTGVYWLGVHVLGALDGGRDPIADGRARTFLPLMRNAGPSTSLSLTMPVRAKVKRDPDGRLRNLAVWRRLLSPEGRLGRLLDLSGTAVDVPLTWLVDPAVIDAARTVASDNAPMDSGPTDTENGTSPSTSPSASPSPSEGTSSDGSADGSDDGSGDGDETSDDAQMAQDWLDSLRRQSEQHEVLATPYGDVDAAALLRGDFADIYQQAVELSAFTMDRLGVPADPVLDPPSGYLPDRVLPKLDPDTSLLLDDRAAPGADSTLVSTGSGPQVIVTDSSATDVGPEPTPHFQALAMRQRILSEAAVHALSGQRDEPLVVSTPQAWDPGGDWRTADFFGGLRVPWLNLADFSSVGIGQSQPYDEGLVYPRRERRDELPLANLLATQELTQVGNVYAELLSRNDSVDEFLAKSANLGSSYLARKRPHAAVNRTRETTKTIRARMGQITIDGPSFVTMSSEEGTFQVTVVNGLDEPVTVGVEAQVQTSAGEAELSIPAPDPVSLGPGQRASVRLRATAKDIGVHSVTLLPTSASGEPLGSSVQFNVRTSQVGLVIWVIMGLGAAVLFVASGVRIARRVRDRKATHGPVLKGAEQ